jgi:hypothetical protein
MSQPMKITQYKALGFSYYGTLVDRNRGVLHALRPLLERTAQNVQPDALLQLYHALITEERRASPTIGQLKLQCLVHDAIARSLGIAVDETVDWEQAMTFAKRMDQWPFYEDVRGALQYLSKFYRLVVMIPTDPSISDALSERLLLTTDIQIVHQPETGHQALLDALLAANLDRNELLPVRSEEEDDPWRDLIDQPVCTLRRDTRHPWNDTNPCTKSQHCEFASMADLVLAHQNALRL